MRIVPPAQTRSKKFIIRDKTTINFQYIYHKAFWLLENPRTLLAPNKRQTDISSNLSKTINIA